MAGLLEGKKVLVTGVLDRRSIAYAAAHLAQEQGAEIALSGFGRAMSLTRRTAKRLGDAEPPVLELDVNKPEDIQAVAEDLRDRWGELHGIVHAVAFAPEDALGGNFLATGGIRQECQHPGPRDLEKGRGGPRGLLGGMGQGAALVPGVGPSL